MMNSRLIKRGGAALLAATLTVLAACGQPQPASVSSSQPESSSSSASSAPSVPALPPEEQVAETAKEIIAAHKEKLLSYPSMKDPEKQYHLDSVKNLRVVEMVTGEYSPNQTKTNYDIGGTDLGIPIQMGDTTYVAFGDTFKKEGMKENWRSNVLAVTTDKDYADGLTFDSMILAKEGVAKELLRGQKIDNVEVTKIPTGGISIGDTLYMSYMSVRHWGEPGQWDCNYGSVAKSEDNGQNWQYLNELKWDGETEFCQMFPVIVDDMVYIAGISGGRMGVARMMRVPVDKYEDITAYEYLTAVNEDGTAVFEKDALDRAYAFLPRAVGEMSIVYSEYLEEWLISYISGPDIILRSAKNIWGPYSEPVTMVKASDFPGLYGAFMSPHWMSEDGSKIGFLMSLWDPVYNVAMMECELVRK